MSLFYFNVISIYWNIIVESVLFIRNVVCIGDMYSLHVSWEFSCLWGIISNVGSIKTNENTYIEEMGITDVLFVSMYWCSSLCFLFYHMMHFNPNYLICILCRHVCYHLKNVWWVHPGSYWGSCYLIFSFICMFCKSLFFLLYFFLLAIVLSVLLRFTDSDYSCGVFKLFFL